MNLKLLIDGIVRQTTVLLAQLSTASGTRLTESASIRQRTLWEAVLELVEQEQPTRARVIERFGKDGEREVAAVLADLLRSGLIFITGSGDGSLYGLTTQAVRDRIEEQHDFDAVVNLAWMKVFRREAVTPEELNGALPVEPALLERAIHDLLASGRLLQEDGQLRSSNVVLPLGGDQGWEAAVLDHFRAVATAIASKVRGGTTGAKSSDCVGGSTFTFTVGPAHPFNEEVSDLFRRTRLEAQALWDRVSEFNDSHPRASEESRRVTFYVGQNVEQVVFDEVGTAAEHEEAGTEEKSSV